MSSRVEIFIFFRIDFIHISNMIQRLDFGFCAIGGLCVSANDVKIRLARISNINSSGRRTGLSGSFNFVVLNPILSFLWVHKNFGPGSELIIVAWTIERIFGYLKLLKVQFLKTPPINCVNLIISNGKFFQLGHEWKIFWQKFELVVVEVNPRKIFHWKEKLIG